MPIWSLPSRSALRHTLRATALTVIAGVASLALVEPAAAQEKTEKPPLHGRHWMAITGKPLGATAGAKMFERGGNAVDAACAMIAATATLWDTLHWGGETQALIWHPGLKKVIAINALGVAPTGATPEFFRARGMKQPPEYGPLAAVTPGTPGGIMVMLAEYGRLSLAEVLAPAIQLADGYPIEAQLADAFERDKAKLKEWPNSARILLPHRNEKGEGREAPRAGEIFVQAELAATLRKLVEAERRALARGATRKQAIMAAYERFYRGDLAREFAAAVQAEGGLITREDLANWQVKIEEPRHTNYRGIDVYKLDTWVQGPVMLQALNILENFDLQAMGYNSARYLHTLYQAMNLSFADRDFYYGDPAFPPAEPITGLLSKDYAKQRAALVGERNDSNIGPGDPYPFQGEVNPFADLLRDWGQRSDGPQQSKPREPTRPFTPGGVAPPSTVGISTALPVYQEPRDPATDPSAPFWRGTTSIASADAEGWLVSVTPSGGWNPAVIAGRTGIGLSQRMQSFVLDARDNPFNVLEPGKRPRATLTPSIAVRDGKPWLSFAVQGGDSQDQNLLQFFLNMVDFGMTPQVAAEAANMNSFQLRDSFGDHKSTPGRMLLNNEVPRWVRRDLISRGYKLEFGPRTSGPITAIEIDRQNASFWGGVSNHGEDHGIAW